MTTSDVRRFRPSLRATVVALPVFLLLLGLGVWQLQRLAWKTDLIDFRAAQLAAPATALPDNATLASDGPAGLEYRRVTVSGRFMHRSEIFLAETHRGKVGFDIVTPLLRADGGVVFVNRGWVPAESRDPAARNDARPDGSVTIEGLVRATGRHNWLTPDNDVEKNYWFWLDPVAMAGFAEVSAPPLVVVMGLSPDTAALPTGHRYEIKLTNDHLYYAITWLLLALALAVIYVMSQMSPPAKDD